LEGTFEAVVLAAVATAIGWAEVSGSLGTSTMLVASLFGTVPEVGSPDVCERGVIGSRVS
jgi:hypothetical protein